MKLPAPEPGLVIRYSYLWRAEHLLGREEGVKNRPCAIVLSTRDIEGELLVTVLPVTHSPPIDMQLALEIPQTIKRRLGLDGDRSWIVFSEANRFVWPGPDLRPLPGARPSTVAYGILPPNFFDILRRRFATALRSHSVVPRSD